MWKIKDSVDLKELEKFGYEEYESYYNKRVTSKRVIKIWKYNREIEDYVIDYTTHSGYKYEGEYRHCVRRHIQDLIWAYIVEEYKEK